MGNTVSEFHAQTVYVFRSSDRLRYGVTGCADGSDLPSVETGVQWTKHTAVPLNENALSSYTICPAIALQRLRAGQTYVVWAGGQIIAFPKKG